MNAVETRRCPSGNIETGGAWLSSARVVRCWVKSRNERNPYGQLPARKGGNSDKTAVDNTEEGGDDVKSSCSLCPGLHTYYNGKYRGKQNREVEQNLKKLSQFRLQSEIRLYEDGIASNCRSAYCSEYVLGPCTHRPSRHESREYPKPVSQP